ncbi:tyrosine recombinase [Tenuifilaceae bacterium CYCD]|nr:tyrosine recombinase [Tenuifilaceae bacterium CYCD]
MDKTLIKAVHNRKGKVLSDGTALIQIEAYLRGKKKYFSTKIYVKPDEWDKKHRQIKQHHPNALRLNKQIADLIKKLNDIELETLNKGKTFNLDMFDEHMNGNFTNSFTEFMDKEIAKSHNAASTITGHKTTLHVLREFKTDILFSEMNYNLLDSFNNYLKNKKLKDEKKLHTNTINKYFRHIRTYVNLAIKKELMDANSYPFKNFELESESTHRGYLTPEEVSSIENLVIPDNKAYLNKVRDMFLFSCYTGLRFSDITALSKESFVTINGEEWLKFTMQKVKEEVSLPLYALFNNKPSIIVNQYIQTDRKFIFDDISNQHMNRCLKEIATLAKVNKEITFHMARHTQATYLLYKGLPIVIIQKLLGHKKISTTQIYSKVMDTTITNELQKVNWG